MTSLLIHILKKRIVIAFFIFGTNISLCCETAGALNQSMKNRETVSPRSSEVGQQTSINQTLQARCEDLFFNIKGRSYLSVFSSCIRYREQLSSCRTSPDGENGLHVFATHPSKENVVNDKNDDLDAKVYAALFYLCKIDVNGRNVRGETPLMVAVAAENASTIFRFLIESSAQKNAQDNTGKTALHHAALTLNKKLITRLLDLRTDPSLLDNAGKTYLDIYNEKMSSMSPQLESSAQEIQVIEQESSVKKEDVPHLFKQAWDYFRNRSRTPQKAMGFSIN